MINLKEISSSSKKRFYYVDAADILTDEYVDVSIGELKIINYYNVNDNLYLGSIKYSYETSKDGVATLTSEDVVLEEFDKFPTIEVTPSYSTNLRQIISWTDTGASEYKIRINGGDWISTGTVASYTPTADLINGSNIIEIKSKSSYSHWSFVDSFKLKVKSVLTAPTITMAETSNNNKPVFTVVGAGTYFRVNFNNRKNWIYIPSNTYSQVLTDGRTTLYAQQSEDGINWSNSGNLTVNITEKEAVVVVIAAPVIVQLADTIDTTPTVAWGAVEGADSYEVSTDGGSTFVDVGNVLTYTYAEQTVGACTIKVRTVIGTNKSEASTMTFNIIDNEVDKETILSTAELYFPLTADVKNYGTLRETFDGQFASGFEDKLTFSEEGALFSEGYFRIPRVDNMEDMTLFLSYRVLNDNRPTDANVDTEGPKRGDLFCLFRGGSYQDDLSGVSVGFNSWSGYCEARDVDTKTHSDSSFATDLKNHAIIFTRKNLDDGTVQLRFYSSKDRYDEEIVTRDTASFYLTSIGTDDTDFIVVGRSEASTFALKPYFYLDGYLKDLSIFKRIVTPSEMDKMFAIPDYNVPLPLLDTPQDFTIAGNMSWGVSWTGLPYHSNLALSGRTYTKPGFGYADTPNLAEGKISVTGKSVVGVGTDFNTFQVGDTIGNGDFNGADTDRIFSIEDATHMTLQNYKMPESSSIDFYRGVLVDSNDYPQHDFGIRLIESQRNDQNLAGTYHCMIKTETEPTISLSAIDLPTDLNFADPEKIHIGEIVIIKPWDETSKVTEYDIVMYRGTQIEVVFTNTGNGAQEMKFMWKDLPLDYEEFVTPVAKEFFRGIEVMRTMDIQETNGNMEKEWTDRNVESVIHNGRINIGTAWENIIKFMIDFDRDTMSNIPELASDDYIAELAKFLKEELPLGRHIYLEYSNEMWNSQFQQTQRNYRRVLDLTDEEVADLNYDNANNSSIGTCEVRVGELNKVYCTGFIKGVAKVDAVDAVYDVDGTTIITPAVEAVDPVTGHEGRLFLIGTEYNTVVSVVDGESAIFEKNFSIVPAGTNLEVINQWYLAWRLYAKRQMEIIKGFIDSPYWTKADLNNTLRFQIATQGSNTAVYSNALEYARHWVEVNMGENEELKDYIWSLTIGAYIYPSSLPDAIDPTAEEVRDSLLLSIAKLGEAFDRLIPVMNSFDLKRIEAYEGGFHVTGDPISKSGWEAFFDNKECVYTVLDAYRLVWARTNGGMFGIYKWDVGGLWDVWTVTDSMYRLDSHVMRWVKNNWYYTKNGDIDAPKINELEDTTILRPTITWNAVEGADSYEVSEDLGETFTNVGNVLSYTFINDLHKKDNEIQVRTVIGATKSDNRSMFFTLLTVAPYIIQLPVNVNTKPKIYWLAVDSADSYKICTDGTNYVNVGNTLDYTYVSDLAAGEHVIKIKTVIGAVESVENTMTFNIISNDTTIITPPTITQLEDTTNATPTINWDLVTGADSYSISTDGVNYTDAGNVLEYTLPEQVLGEVTVYIKTVVGGVESSASTMTFNIIEVAVRQTAEYYYPLTENADNHGTLTGFDGVASGGVIFGETGAEIDGIDGEILFPSILDMQDISFVITIRDGGTLGNTSPDENNYVIKGFSGASSLANDPGIGLFISGGIGVIEKNTDGYGVNHASFSTDLSDGNERTFIVTRTWGTTTANKSDFKIYMKGDATIESSTTGRDMPQLASINTFLIGLASKGIRFKGSIRELAIFRRILTEDERNECFLLSTI